MMIPGKLTTKGGHIIKVYSPPASRFTTVSSRNTTAPLGQEFGRPGVEHKLTESLEPVRCGLSLGEERLSFSLFAAHGESLEPVRCVACPSLRKDCCPSLASSFCFLLFTTGCRLHWSPPLQCLSRIGIPPPNGNRRRTPTVTRANPISLASVLELPQ